MLNKIAFEIVNNPRGVSITERRAFAAGFAKRAEALGMRPESVARFVKIAQAAVWREGDDLDNDMGARYSTSGMLRPGNRMGVGDHSQERTMAKNKTLLMAKINQRLTGSHVAQVVDDPDPNWVSLQVYDANSGGHKFFRVPVPRGNDDLEAYRSFADAVELSDSAYLAAQDAANTSTFNRVASRILRRAKSYFDGTSRNMLFGGRRSDATYAENIIKARGFDRTTQIEGLEEDPEKRRGAAALDMSVRPEYDRTGAGSDAGRGRYGDDVTTNRVSNVNPYYTKPKRGNWIHDAEIRYETSDGEASVPLPDGFAMAEPEFAPNRRGWNAVIVNTKTGYKQRLPFYDKGAQIEYLRRVSGDANYAPGFKPADADPAGENVVIKPIKAGYNAADYSRVDRVSKPISSILNTGRAELAPGDIKTIGSPAIGGNQTHQVMRVTKKTPAAPANKPVGGTAPADPVAPKPVPVAPAPSAAPPPSESVAATPYGRPVFKQTWDIKKPAPRVTA